MYASKNDCEIFTDEDGSKSIIDQDGDIVFHFMPGFEDDQIWSVLVAINLYYKIGFRNGADTRSMQIRDLICPE